MLREACKVYVEGRLKKPFRWVGQDGQTRFRNEDEWLNTVTFLNRPQGGGPPGEPGGYGGGGGYGADGGYGGPEEPSDADDLPW